MRFSIKHTLCYTNERSYVYHEKNMYIKDYKPKIASVSTSTRYDKKMLKKKKNPVKIKIIY